MWSLCLRIFGIVEALRLQPITVTFKVVFSKNGEISVNSVNVTPDYRPKTEDNLPIDNYSTIDMLLNQGTVEFNTNEMWIVQEKQVNISLDLLYVHFTPTSVLTSKAKIRDRKFCSTVTVPVNSTGVRRTSTTTAKPVRNKITRGFTRYPVRFATYKSHTRRSNNDNEQQQPFVDIGNDKKAFEEVRRSRTEDINATWISTFLTFFGIEVLLMLCFVSFGLIMFVALQFRPKNANGGLLDIPYTS